MVFNNYKPTYGNTSMIASESLGTMPYMSGDYVLPQSATKALYFIAGFLTVSAIGAIGIGIYRYQKKKNKDNADEELFWKWRAGTVALTDEEYLRLSPMLNQGVKHGDEFWWVGKEEAKRLRALGKKQGALNNPLLRKLRSI